MPNSWEKQQFAPGVCQSTNFDPNQARICLIMPPCLVNSRVAAPRQSAGLETPSFPRSGELRLRAHATENHARQTSLGERGRISAPV
jgi:hypothetical protein